MNDAKKSKIVKTDRTDPNIFVDPRVQRSLKTGRAAEMAKQFNPDGLGILTASQRDDGRQHLIDGQTRWAAAGLANYDGPITVQIYTGLDLADEAALFLVRNATSHPSAVDRFLVRIWDNDEAAHQMNRILAANEWTVARSNGNGRYAAVSSLEKVYNLPRTGPEAAEATVAVITAAWGHKGEVALGILTESIGRFIHRYGDEVDLDDLKDRLAKYPGGPSGLYGQARGYASGRGLSVTRGMIETVWSLYNARRRSTALAPY